MTVNPSDKYRAPALEKGLAIIEHLALQPTAQSQSEIAAGLDKSPNEIYRMLASLEHGGYLYRDPVSSKYSLTLKLYYLSRRHSFVEKLRTASLNAMKDCSAKIQQPCHLSVLYDGQVMVIAYSRSPAPIAVTIGEGNLYASSQTASGKLLLSFTEPEAQLAILENDGYYRGLSKSRRKEFHVVLTNIKQRGYYEMPSTYAQGIVDIAVPIGNSNTGVIACLTVPKLITIQPKEDIPNSVIVQELMRCKAEIEGNLGLGD